MTPLEECPLVGGQGILHIRQVLFRKDFYPDSQGVGRPGDASTAAGHPVGWPLAEGRGRGLGAGIALPHPSPQNL